MSHCSVGSKLCAVLCDAVDNVGDIGGLGGVGEMAFGREETITCFSSGVDMVDDSDKLLSLWTGAGLVACICVCCGCCCWGGEERLIPLSVSMSPSSLAEDIQ